MESLAPPSGGFSGLTMRPSPERFRELADRQAPRLNRLASTLAATAKAALPADLPNQLQARSGSEREISPEQRLIQRITMGATQVDLAQIETLGYFGFLDYHLDTRRTDDRPLEEALEEALPTLTLSAAEILFNYFLEEPEVPLFEQLGATLLRSVYNPRQLYERMVVFWTDHFNIDILSDFQIATKPVDQRDVIRKHAMGKFSDLLRASAMSPAMLTYLTNDSNVKDHPNENYSRELMELHTMGVDNGYTQEDVREVARCFTGWTVHGFDAGPRALSFRFQRLNHDFGEKTVLGHTIPAGGGREDGLAVLDILARHENTAVFIATKLLRYFWGAQPSQRMIDHVAEKFIDTEGDIPAVLRVILNRRWMSTAESKLKRPYHLATSSIRALFAQIENPIYTLFQLYVAGHLPFAWSPPNGYPDSRAYWSGFMIPRWDFTSVLGYPEASGVRFDLPYLNPDLAPGELTRRIDWLLSNRTFNARTRFEVQQFLRDGDGSPRHMAQAVGLALASPEFQDY